MIDRNGVEIVGASIEPFAGYLPVVTGLGAPEHANELIAVLVNEPQLYEQSLAATRVGNRRWDLTLIGDVVVMLPDSDLARAWSILAEAQRRGRLLDRAINRSTCGPLIALWLQQRTQKGPSRLADATDWPCDASSLTTRGRALYEYFIEGASPWGLAFLHGFDFRFYFDGKFYVDVASTFGARRDRGIRGLFAALDVGSSTVTCLLCHANGRGEVQVIGMGTRRAEGFSNGNVVNAPAAQQSILNAINQAEEVAGETT